MTIDTWLQPVLLCLLPLSILLLQCIQTRRVAAISVRNSSQRAYAELRSRPCAEFHHAAGRSGVR